MRCLGSRRYNGKRYKQGVFQKLPTRGLSAWYKAWTAVAGKAVAALPDVWGLVTGFYLTMRIP